MSLGSRITSNQRLPTCVHTKRLGDPSHKMRDSRRRCRKDPLNSSAILIYPCAVLLTSALLIPAAVHTRAIT